MSSIAQLAARIRHRAKVFVGERPYLYRAIYGMRSGYRDRMVDSATDVCIEGYPRSANSFAVGALESVQDRSVRIAHHNHVPAPVLHAVELGVPVVVLIREPVEAIVSSRALELQIGAVEGRTPPHVPYDARLEAWISFYDHVCSVLDEVVAAPFEVVISDFGQVVDALNRRFDTSFKRFEHTPEAVKSLRETRGYHALPSSQRDALKTQAREVFDIEVGMHHRLVRRARNLRVRILEHAEEAHRYALGPVLERVRKPTAA